MTLSKPNIRVLNILYGLSLAVSFIYLISTFVVATKECVLRSGCSDMYNLFGVFPGESFAIVFIGFFWIAIFSSGLYYINTEVTELTYGTYLSASLNVVVTAVCAASWASAKLKAINDAAEALADPSSVGLITDSQFSPAMRSMIVGAGLIVFLQVAFLVCLVWWKEGFFSRDSGDSLYAETIGRNIDAYQPPSTGDDIYGSQAEAFKYSENPAYYRNEGMD